MAIPRIENRSFAVAARKRVLSRARQQAVRSPPNKVKHRLAGMSLHAILIEVLIFSLLYRCAHRLNWRGSRTQN